MTNYDMLAFFPLFFPPFPSGHEVSEMRHWYPFNYDALHSVSASGLLGTINQVCPEADVAYSTSLSASVLLSHLTIFSTLRDFRNLDEIILNITRTKSKTQLPWKHSKMTS